MRRTRTAAAAVLVALAIAASAYAQPAEDATTVEIRQEVIAAGELVDLIVTPGVEVLHVVPAAYGQVRACQVEDGVRRCRVVLVLEQLLVVYRATTTTPSE